jgi:Rrf2 family protein
MIPVQLSQAARYAIQALVFMGQERNGGVVASSKIADAHGVPEPVLSKTLLTLAAEGLLQSVKGASGGYRLARPLAEISLLDIVEAVNGPVRCQSSFFSDGTTGTLDRNLEAIAERAAEGIRRQFQRIRLSHLAGEAA